MGGPLDSLTECRARATPTGAGRNGRTGARQAVRSYEGRTGPAAAAADRERDQGADQGAAAAADQGADQGEGGGGDQGATADRTAAPDRAADPPPTFPPLAARPA